MESLGSFNPTSIIVFAVLFSLVAFVHELGHFIFAKRAGIRVEEFAFGLPPRVFSVTRGETAYSLNLIPVLAYVRLQGEEDPTEPRSFARATKLWRVLVLLAGPVMNLMLAVLLFAAGMVAGVPTATETEVTISDVNTGSPADLAGILPGDVIINVGGQPISRTIEMLQITESFAGRPMPMVVRRDGLEIPLTVNVRSVKPENQGLTGIRLGDKATRIEQRGYPLHQALILGLEQTGKVVALTFAVPVMLVRQQIPIEMARPVSPVGIYQITSQVTNESVQTGWWFPLLSWAGMLSAALGITNLLPLPGLDGGRLVFVALEAIRRRRVRPDREALVHIAGMVALLVLVVMIAYSEIVNPIQIPGMGP